MIIYITDNICTLYIHGHWVRFLKVKEELRVMREERTKKENAYRLMQRESKQCDVIQKELTKLKESKVSYLLCFMSPMYL